jgi:hypothetical protein
LGSVLRELANLQFDIQEFHDKLIADKNLTGLQDEVDTNYLRNKTTAAEMAGATWQQRFEAMEAYAENTFGEYQLYQQASNSNVARLYVSLFFVFLTYVLFSLLNVTLLFL